MFQEVAENAASGRVAEIYDDIRRVLGLPMVNLLYRHLATRPERLDEAWTALRPNLGSQAAKAAAAKLTAEARTASTAAPAPLPPAKGPLVVATLDAYARANSLNLLGMYALLDGCPGSGEGGEAVEPPPATEILPMADLASLAPPVRARLEELGESLVDAEEPRLVPSLPRHFAHDPQLLDVLEKALWPAVPDIPARAGAIRESARALAAGLPYQTAPVTEGAVRTLAERFTGAMSGMLVAGEIIRAAIGKES